MSLASCGLGQYFQDFGHFFIIRTDPKPVNNMYIFSSCRKSAYKWVCLPNFVIELAYAQSTNHSQKKFNKRTSE